MNDQFVEIFPIEPSALPVLAAYSILADEALDDPEVARLGARFARRLNDLSDGAWMWADRRIVTDEERSALELMVALDNFQSDLPGRFDRLRAIEQDIHWQAPPGVSADFLIRFRLSPLHTKIHTALQKRNLRLKNAVVEREHRFQPWTVHGQAALSASIASRMIYNPSLLRYLGGDTDPQTLRDRLLGLWAAERRSGARGEIVRIAGVLGDHRERLLQTAPDDTLREMIGLAPDSEPVLGLRVGGRERLFIMGALQLMVRLSQLQRFDLDAAQAAQALQMRPGDRAQLVRVVSDLVKSDGLIANAYNSRTSPDNFKSARFEMNVRYAGGRTRPYDKDTLRHDFARLGPYKLRDAYKRSPIRVCVVNALPFRLADFVEAMRRALDKEFDFSIDVIRERQVRVVSRANLESAVRVVERESPDIILTFFPDEFDDDDDDEGDSDATASFLRSLTLGRGIPTHVITESTLNDPEAMPLIIMGILGKTGNSPFVLTEPLEHADFVVGLDFVRAPIKGAADIHLTAVARIYRADGEFMRYVVRESTLEGGKLPFVLLRDLLSQKDFAGKRIVTHHDGRLPEDLRSALTLWGQAIKAEFYPVEIRRFGAPRIYGTGAAGVQQPPWGCAFALNDAEAVLVSSLPPNDVTPQPLHIRAADAGAGALHIDSALRGVLVWTLLAYGADRLPKLPVTVINAVQLAQWLEKGGHLSAEIGDSPFWL